MGNPLPVRNTTVGQTVLRYPGRSTVEHILAEAFLTDGAPRLRSYPFITAAPLLFTLFFVIDRLRDCSSGGSFTLSKIQFRGEASYRAASCVDGDAQATSTLFRRNTSPSARNQERKRGSKDGDSFAMKQCMRRMISRLPASSPARLPLGYGKLALRKDSSLC